MTIDKSEEEEKVEWRSVVFLLGPADFLWPPRDRASLKMAACGVGIGCVHLKLKPESERNTDSDGNSSPKLNLWIPKT
jgi:hypothetical protein